MANDYRRAYAQSILIDETTNLRGRYKVELFAGDMGLLWISELFVPWVLN
jgi:hypothetical protein